MTKIFENLKILTPSKDFGMDGIQINGETAIIRNCVIDFEEIGLSEEEQDEALSCVNNSNCTITDTVLENVGKAFLCGSGDDDSPQGGYVYMENCIIRNFGRRAPEGQDKIIIHMKNCKIENWGHHDYFTVRSFGAWAHHGSEIHCENCLFIQKSFFQSGLLNFFIDLGNHIGQSFKYRSLNILDYIIPGVCRGLTQSKKGKVTAKNCYKNKWWIRIQNCSSYMSYEDACKLNEKLENLH